MSQTVNPPVVTKALWDWTTAQGTQPVVQGYPTVASGSPGHATKSGMTPTDLRNYMVVPVQNYGLPSPTPLPDTTLLQWIRWAEDEIEQETNIRLCQTWIAAPPAKTHAETVQLNFVTSGLYQNMGVDYDLYEPPYDFFFPRVQDEGWFYLKTRWRPVQSVEITDFTGAIDAANLTGIKNWANVYPLLNEYFQAPLSWFVEDQRRGYIRLVPATNVAMLPLFALQLALMGFAESVPGGIWIQYTAGLTANDYNSEFSFIRQLVLAKAAIIGFGLIGVSLNFGATETQMSVDGLSYKTVWSKDGPFAGQIKTQQMMADKLTKQAKSKVAGATIGML